MAIPHARSGQVIQLSGAANGPDSAERSRTQTLVKTEALEVIRMVLPAGKEIREHKAKGDITVHCLEGKIEFQVADESCDLTPGTLLYLDAGAPHSLKASDDSVLLLTLVLVSKLP